jgi:hypothetical protein
MAVNSFKNQVFKAIAQKMTCVKEIFLNLRVSLVFFCQTIKKKA